jgi:N-acetylglucosaminyl-diphospho-decaprenol L-rhamnosyltransferase
MCAFSSGTSFLASPAFGKMSLSVLIVNWKSKDYLRECLKSIQVTSEELVTQIVVVDGGSFDGCGEMLANEFPSVQFVQSGKNLGFGRSNNLGFEQVTGELLFLLNPDTELKPNALQRMLLTLEELPQAGIIGARLLNTDGSLQTSCVQSFPTPLNQALDSNLFRELFPKSKLWGTYPAFFSDESVAVEAISGASMLMRSDTFRRIEGFDPKYFMYGEDMDLCRKTHNLELKVYFQPQAEIIHHGGGSSDGEFSNFSTVFMRQSIHAFIQERQGSSAALLYRFSMALSAFMRMTALSVSQVFSPACKRSKNKSSFKKWTAILRWSIGMEKWTERYT